MSYQPRLSRTLPATLLNSNSDIDTISCTGTIMEKSAKPHKLIGFLKDMNILRCPKCLGEFHQTGNESQSLICSKCHQAYSRLGRFYDFYIEDELLPKTDYPPDLEHLNFNVEKILSLGCHKSNRILDVIKHHFINKEWEMKLEKLRNTVKQYGCSERKRVEFMVDDYTSADFLRQHESTETKAKVIMRYISSVKHTGNYVLHVGCGGLCNEAIPKEYENAGFVNHGVDAVRSYVLEFLNFGQAHLANALALPYGDAIFDIVNFTDILEHLFDPLRGLREAARVLKQDGYLILTTPNRSPGIDRHNLLESMIGAAFPAILGQRNITGQWAGETFFHMKFTKKEVVSLLHQSGFKPVLVRTYSVLKSPKSVLKRTTILIIERVIPTAPWCVLARKI